MNFDLLIKNGLCYSVKKDSFYDWIGIKDGKIIALGHKDDYEAYGTPQQIVDANGKTVLPGFYDSCMHFVQSAINSTFINLNTAQSFADIKEIIRSKISKNHEAPIICYGLDELNLIEKKVPDRRVLDDISSSAPIWISRVEYHTSILNTYGLLYYKVPFTLPGIEVDRKKVPTGVFRYLANAYLRETALNELSMAYRLQAAENLIPTLLKKGITSINAMEGGFTFADKDADFLYHYGKSLPLDLLLFYQTTSISKIKELGLPRIGGSLFIDGAFGSRNAALFEDYSDSPGVRGDLYYSQEDLNRFVLSCYENDLQLAVHAVGERAIDLIINAHRFATDQTGKKHLRHRIEHVEMPTAHHLSEACDMNLIFSMQPAFEYYWGGPDKMYAKRLGDRYLHTNPFREIIDHGITICGGSDSDVTPADPLLGIASAINHPIEAHRVTLKEALQMFTTNGAYAVHEEKHKGDIEEEFQADLVILDGDIFATPTDQIKDVEALYTIKNGNILYQKNEGR